MKKIIFVALFFVICSSLSGYLFHVFFQNSYKTQNSLDKIFLYFSQGKLDLSKDIVKNYSLSSTGRKFLSAVFLQQNQQFEKSNSILKKIFEEHKFNASSKKLNFLEEALAMKILNHFLLNQKKELSQEIKQFQNYFSDSPLLPLVEAISSYDNTITSEAIKKISFSLHSYKQNNLNNSWFFYNLKQLIPSRALLLKKAHNLILIQKFDKARSIINKELEQLFLNPSQWSKEDYQTSIILYAFSYFYELKNLEIQELLDNSSSYYETISFYLEKLDSNCHNLYTQYFSNNDLLLSCLKAVENFSKEKLFVLAKILFYHKKYSKMNSSQFMENFFSTTKEAKNIFNFIHLLKVLDDISEEPNHYVSTFKKQILETFKTYLINDSFEEGKKLFTIFGKELTQLHPNLIDIILNQIILFRKNTYQIEQWLDLCEPLFNEKHHSLIAKELFSQSKILWEKGEQKIALQLIELIFRKKKLDSILKDITDFLEKIYLKAKDNRDFKSLILIEHLKETYNLKIDYQISPEALANLIADISYLYQQGNYLQAKQLCQWLLYLHPNSDIILELLAKSLFEEKNYQEALKYFAKISNKKLDTEHCIFACKELIKQQSQ